MVIELLLFLNCTQLLEESSYQVIDSKIITCLNMTFRNGRADPSCRQTFKIYFETGIKVANKVKLYN